MNKKEIAEIFDTLNNDQRDAVCTILEGALDKEPEEMKHSDITASELLAQGRKMGSLREAVLEHAENYGIKGIETLFPDPKNLNNPPGFINNETGWVSKVLNGVYKSPFSRIKSSFADITADAARAKGYTKGNRKKEEVFTLLKRTTSPTTIYKKQKLDRDDIIDITDFDVVSWIRAEMRMKLDEEIARAILIGDGRLISDDDHIDEQCIRPIYNDDDLYSIKYAIDSNFGIEKGFVVACLKSRKQYKGSGEPVLFTTEDLVSDLLLLEDNNGRAMYGSVQTLCNALRVKDIITVSAMEGLTRPAGDGKTHNVKGIIVNLRDYNVGADRGGQISMFQDFDIDYNQHKYLIETRCSGALTVPYSAIVIEEVVTP